MIVFFGLIRETIKTLIIIYKPYHTKSQCPFRKKWGAEAPLVERELLESRFIISYNLIYVIFFFATNFDACINLGVEVEEGCLRILIETSNTQLNGFHFVVEDSESSAETPEGYFDLFDLDHGNCTNEFHEVFVFSVRVGVRLDSHQ